MIQRSQSVYLLLVTVLMSFLLIRPYAELTLSDGRMLTFRSTAIRQHTDPVTSTVYKVTIPVVLLVMLAGMVSFGNIFLFNHRITQMRICIVNGLLLLALLIIMYIYYSSSKQSLQVSMHAFRTPAIFPVVAIVLTFLAYRNIQHDEALVNSYNRLR